MRMRTAWLALTAMLVTLAAGTGSAHHSFAAFDMTKTLAISGTVTKWVWANPHSWLYVAVAKTDGTHEEWAFECSSPNMMIRWGWHYSDIKVGDKITIDAHPSRDGGHRASVYAVYFANGRVVADPMGRHVTGDDLANGAPSLPTKPTGIAYH